MPRSRINKRFIHPKGVEGRADRTYHDAFNRERLDAHPKKGLTTNALHGASIFLFKHILSPQDARWRLAYTYARLKEKGSFDPVNLHNAVIATYGSKSPGTPMRQYESYIDIRHTTQLARALTNIEIGNNFIHLEKKYPIKGKYSMQFERTKSIARGKDKRGVTGCPEALWQLQLYHDGVYLGRIGINFHNEGTTRIVTISNIQGAEGKNAELTAFKNMTGKRFNEALVVKLKEILGARFHYRGIVNSDKNPAMYQMTFRKAKIPTYTLTEKKPTTPASA